MEGWTTNPSNPNHNDNDVNIIVVYNPVPVEEFWKDHRFDDMLRWLRSSNLVLLTERELWVKVYA